METDSYVELVLCPLADEPVVEFMDHHGLVHRYSQAQFCTEFESAYDDGDLQYVLSCMPITNCSCCRWGEA